MRTTRTAEQTRLLLFSFALALALLVPGISAADRESNPGEVLMLSDELFGRSVGITRGSVSGTTGDPSTSAGSPADDPSAENDVNDDSDDALASAGNGPGNDHNRSGLGDGSNPGQGDGTENSPNEGTDNPNNASPPGNQGNGNKHK